MERVSLLSAVESIKEVADLIEEVEASEVESSSEEYDSLLNRLIPAFNHSVDNLKSAVDRRVALIQSMPHVVAIAESHLAYYQRRIKTAKHVLERIKESTKAVLLANPNVEFQGSNKKLALQKNGGAVPIEYRVELQRLDNIVDPQDVPHFDEKYLRKVQVFVLDKQGFDDDLRNGMTECSAVNVLERGCHVRVK